jgi:hypothetical protein
MWTRLTRLNKNLIFVFLISTVVGCASNPPVTPPDQVGGRTICDTYIIMSMCVRDLVGDDTVDMVYFTDTKEIFMYQEGRRDVVAGVMPFHQCAVPLSEGMQSTTNRILNRDNLGLAEELEITRLLISNYVAAKPTIDACNEKYEDSASGDAVAEDEFSDFESDWSS